MSVTKRVRFEVLRRDGHDDPSNLVAACKDCNAGKASTNPDAELVADVADDALRHAEMIRQAYAVLVSRMGERDDYIWQFDEAYTYEPMPDDWRNTIARWFEMGVPIELVVDAARIACSTAQTFRGTGRFSYMCGIVWKRVHAVNEATEAKRALDGAFMSDDAIQKLMFDEYNQGMRTGGRQAFDEWAPADILTRMLWSVVDKSPSVFGAGGPNVERLRAESTAVLTSRPF